MKSATLFAASVAVCAAAATHFRSLPLQSNQPVSQSDPRAQLFSQQVEECAPIHGTKANFTPGHWKWVFSAVPHAAWGSYEEVSRVVLRSDWDAMNTTQRRIMRQRILSARTGKPMFTTCFAPGTDPAVVRAFRRVDNTISHFRVSNRWTTTASTPMVNQGGPMVLTWNIVNDGTPIPPPAATSSSNLHSFAATSFGGEDALRSQMRTVFARYEQLTGIRYVEVDYDDGAAFPDSPGVAGVRADIRIAGASIDGTGGILAYNYFPNYGDMVLDTSDGYLTSTPTVDNPNPLLVMRNVVSHEHGHGLGLEHVCPVNQTKLMEPYLSTAFEGPQLDDIQADQHYYGDTYEYPKTNNSMANATALGTIVSGATAVSTVSIGDVNDTDFYRFKTDGRTIKFVASLSYPGSTYYEGPQDGTNPDGCGTSTSFNPTNQRDLGVRVLDSSGNVLSDANAGAAGTPEAATVQSLPGSGPFFVQVYSTDGKDVPQLYTLTLSFNGGTTSTATVSGRCASIYANPAFDGTARSGVFGATVYLKTVTGTTITSTTTDSNGNYILPKVPSGSYLLSAQYYRDPNTLVTLDPPVRTIQVAGENLGVPRFALYSVFGIIKASNGTGGNSAVSGATVHLYNKQGVEIGSKLTGWDGRYQFKNLRTSDYTVKITHPNYVFPDKAVTLPTTQFAWSPCVRAHIIGTAGSGAAASSPSGHSS